MPVMAGGIAGDARTVSVLAPPVPQEFVAETESEQLTKFDGQLTVTALRLAGPTIVPQGVVHV